MGLIVLGLLILAMAGHSSKPEYSVFASSPRPNCAAYCACKQGLSDAVLQKAIDYACGAGADCNPIRPNGQCYNPNTVVNHCSYAVNSYYQKKSASGATCDFGGVASLTNSPPSGGGCSSSSSSSTGTGTTVPTTGTTPTTTPVIGTGIGVTPTTGTSPYTTSPTIGTPSNGVLGGVGTGMAPTGTGMDDSNGGVIKLEKTIWGSTVMLVISCIMCLWD